MFAGLDAVGEESVSSPIRCEGCCVASGYLLEILLISVLKPAAGLLKHVLNELFREVCCGGLVGFLGCRFGKSDGPFVALEIFDAVWTDTEVSFNTLPLSWCQSSVLVIEDALNELAARHSRILIAAERVLHTLPLH